MCLDENGVCSSQIKHFVFGFLQKPSCQNTNSGLNYIQVRPIALAGPITWDTLIQVPPSSKFRVPSSKFRQVPPRSKFRVPSSKFRVPSSKFRQVPPSSAKFQVPPSSKFRQVPPSSDYFKFQVPKFPVYYYYYIGFYSILLNFY